MLSNTAPVVCSISARKLFAFSIRINSGNVFSFNFYSGIQPVRAQFLEMQDYAAAGRVALSQKPVRFELHFTEKWEALYSQWAHQDAQQTEKRREEAVRLSLSREVERHNFAIGENRIRK